MLALSDKTATLGQRTYLSTIDIFQLNKLYSCQGLLNYLPIPAYISKSLTRFLKTRFFVVSLACLFNFYFYMHIDNNKLN